VGRSPAMRHAPASATASWEGKMEVLLIAFGALIAIWLVVLLGSRLLGPR